VSQKPLPSKKWYDIASWLATQTTFSFVAAPFIILGFKESLEVWSRVYYYAIITTFSTLAFFASPAKVHVRKMLEKRTRGPTPRLSRTTSTESLDGNSRTPTLGVSADPGKDLDEAMKEIQDGVDRARRNSIKKKA
jgi:lysophospholipid acyltransferase